MEIKVNFLFIGPDKSGSSWLYKLLLAHPDCFVPRIKDIYFFDRYYSKGTDWYLKRFKDVKVKQKAIGELSHDYLFSSDACARIHRFNPDIKLLTSLREPTSRSFSHYLYLKRSGLTKKPLLEALVDYPKIISNSRYHEHLRIYRKTFKKEQIKVLFFEMLREDPRRFAEEVFDFLGLHKDVELPPKERAAAKARSYLIARTMKIGANTFRAFGIDSMVGLVKESPICKLLYEEYVPDEKPQMTDEEFKFLTSALADVKSETEKILGVKIPNWT